MSEIACELSGVEEIGMVIQAISECDELTLSPFLSFAQFLLLYAMSNAMNHIDDECAVQLMRVMHLQETVGTVHCRKVFQLSGKVRSIRFRIPPPRRRMLIRILEVRSMVRIESQSYQRSPFPFDFGQMLIGSGLECSAAADSLSTFPDVQFAASGTLDGVDAVLGMTC